MDDSVRSTYSKAERETVLLTCSYCRREFHPRPYTRRLAKTNQCSRPCQVAETDRSYGGSGISRSRRWSPASARP